MKKIIIVLLVLSISACKKDFLEARPDKALLVPTSLDDLEKILNNDPVMAFAPELQLIASDEFAISDAALLNLSAPERNSYLWAKDIYEGNYNGDWAYSYRVVYYANVILETLSRLPPETAVTTRYKQLKGSALFYRAFAFYNLAQLFCAPYEAATAAQQPGIPIRLKPDVDLASTRGTVQATYQQIIADLQTAESLVPATQILYKNIGQPAVRALLARVYLSMADYEKAGFYADAALQLKSDLIDFNDLNAADYRPFPLAPGINKEMLAYSQLGPYAFDYIAYTEPALFASYAAKDLRKTIYFSANGDGTFAFKGTYSGSSTLFGGLATDELYLIRAEANARSGQLSAALTDLNTLLFKRWQKDTYVPYSSTVQQDIIKKILEERKKELIGRGLRWTDLRRLNKEPNFAVSLSRNFSGQTYTLPPNDPRYVFPIPDEEIRASGIPQNSR